MAWLYGKFSGIRDLLLKVAYHTVDDINPARNKEYTIIPIV